VDFEVEKPAPVSGPARISPMVDAKDDHDAVLLVDAVAVEIAASTVVIWERSGTGEARQRRALRMVGAAFVARAVYLLLQSAVLVFAGWHPRHSPVGIAWTGSRPW